MNVQGPVTLTRRFPAAPTLSPRARLRLQWVDYYRRHARNARKTCRHFGISPATFYR